ncbi:MAG: histidine kinase, partial [Muribaculaceae bacterium]|nr:histidine kinase [Muribaculaceae bacterium]
MEKRVIYILCFCVIVFITFELMMLSLVWGYEVVGNRIILMTLPGILIGFFAVLFTTRFLVPRFLLRGRLVLFGIFTFLTAYAVLLSFLEIENIGLRSIGVAPRIESWGSPVIFIERACDSVIMTIILFSLGAYSLYKEGDRVSKKEQESASLLNSYIANVKYRLDQNEINRCLGRIEDDLKKEVGSAEIEREIDNLSDYLRKQLYEMPVPPAVKIAVESRRSEKIGNFLTGKRWRWVRALLFQFVLVLMSLEALFPLPDRISTDKEGLAMCFSIYCLLNLLVLINKYWLRRRFHRHRSAKRYIVETVCVVTIPFFGFVLYNLLTSPSPVAEVYHPFWIMVPSTLGAYSSMILLMGGVTTIFLLKNRIETQQRMDMLSAETARQEFLFLKKQINPHFLFNVLNNINILGYEDKAEA